jgi:hypothetical protein
MIHDRTRCAFGYLQKAKPQSLSRSHIRDLCGIVNRSIALVGEVQMLSTRFDNLN